MKKQIVFLVCVLSLAGIVNTVMADMNIKWRLGTNHPTYRKAGVLELFEGSIYSIAGCEYPWAESADSYSYEISNNQWIDRPDLPVGRAYTNGISVGDSIYLCGGRNSEYTKTECYKMTRVGGYITWTQISSLQEDRGYYPIAKVGTKIIVAGGNKNVPGQEQWTATSTMDSVEYYDTAYPNLGWRSYSDIPVHSRCSAACAGIDNKLYLFGGAYRYDANGTTTYIRMYDSHVLNTSTDTWSDISDLPEGRSGAAALAYEDRFVILLGGYVADNQTYAQYDNRCLVYDTVTDTYTEQPSVIPYGCADMRAVLYGNKIYCVGGEILDSSHSYTDNHFKIGTITFPSITFLDSSGNMDRSYDKKCPEWSNASFFYNPEQSWTGWVFNSQSNVRKPIGVGDVTGDGYDDFVLISDNGEIKCIVMSYTGVTDLLQLHNPKYYWGWPFSSQDDGTVPLGVGDYNGDGYADIFVIERDGDIRVLTTNGSQIIGLYDIGNPKTSWGWGFSSNPAETQYDAIGIADYDGDGKDDIWVLDENGLVRVITMNGDTDGTGIEGLFDVGNPYLELGWGFRPNNHSVRPVKLCDVNGDGYSDLVTVNASGQVRALIVAEDGEFDWDYVDMDEPYSDLRLQADQFTTKPLDIPYGWDWWWQ